MREYKTMRLGAYAGAVRENGGVGPAGAGSRGALKFDDASVVTGGIQRLAVGRPRDTPNLSKKIRQGH